MKRWSLPLIALFFAAAGVRADAPKKLNLLIITADDRDIYLKGEPDVARGWAPRRTLRGRHPLWLLSVLAHADAAGTAGELTVVRDVETRRYEFTFDTRQIERRIGERLDRPHLLRRPPFPAVLCSTMTGGSEGCPRRGR